MKRSIRTALLAACTLLIGSPAIQAQDDGPAFQPLEMWACNFRDRKDQDDMDSVYEQLVDATGDAAYASWQLNPYFAGARVRDFDFLYLGAWSDGSAMGADLESYMADATEIGEAWDETVECGAMMFASNTIQDVPASDGEGSGTFMLTVSDCKIAHGRTAAQAIGAISRYNDYRVANGSVVPTFAWFPVYGDGSAEFDFKLAQAYSGPQAMGDQFSWIVDNQSYNVENALTQGLVDCDEARAYVGRTIMDNLD
jgi:hypothetical protein